MALERLATSRGGPFGLRFYSAMFILFALASLRFCDARGASQFWANDTSVCGASIDHKSESDGIMVWASPESGFATDALWFAPITKIWLKVKPRGG